MKFYAKAELDDGKRISLKFEIKDKVGRQILPRQEETWAAGTWDSARTTARRLLDEAAGQRGAKILGRARFIKLNKDG